MPKRPRAAYSYGMIFVPEDELGGILKELHLHGKRNLKFEYRYDVEAFVFENVDNYSVAKSIREILWEAGLVYDPARDPNRLDPVAGRL